MYIDDLIRELNADDIAVICESKSALLKTIEAEEKLCETNKIQLNRNKNVISVNMGETEAKENKGIPAVDYCGYLKFFLVTIKY